MSIEEELEKTEGSDPDLEVLDDKTLVLNTDTEYDSKFGQRYLKIQVSDQKVEYTRDNFFIRVLGNAGSHDPREVEKVILGLDEETHKPVHRVVEEGYTGEIEEKNMDPLYSIDINEEGLDVYCLDEEGFEVEELS